jgi:hypothetical protein
MLDKPTHTQGDFLEATAAGGDASEPCGHCGKPFQPRKGGKPQRYCSPICKSAAREQRTATGATGEATGNVATFPEPARDIPADDESDFVWAIDAQEEITTRALANGGVEIWQDGQHGPDDAVTIHVAAHNAVQLARNILYAAGFKSALIATGAAGGWSDVEDGDTPADFPAPKPRPEPKATTPEEIEALTRRMEAAVKPAEPAAEPEPEPEWSEGADGVAIAHQPGIRVYMNQNGSISVRQHDPDPDTGQDPIITVTPSNVPALVKALQAEAQRPGA